MTPTADAVVVGAGIFGTSIAYQLARKGAGRILLVERSVPAGGMSGRSFEQVRRHYSNELMVRLATRGFEVFGNWDREVGVYDPGYVRTGYLLAVGPDAVDACRGNVELGISLGVDTSFVSPEEIGRIEPLLSLEGIGGGAFEPDGGFIDVHRIIAAWFVAGMAQGVEPLLGTTVEGIELEGRAVAGVRTSDGVVRSPVVVNAAGCWGSELVADLGVELPISFLRLQIGRLRQPDGRPRLRRAVTDATADLVARPDRGPIDLAVAYEASAPEPAPDWDSAVRDGYEAHLRSILHARIPEYDEASWEGGVSGHYDVTPDWHPILGWTPGIEGLYLALGWSGHGLKLAPAVGEVVADEVLGREPFVDVSPLRLERFAAGHPMRLAYGPGARA